MLKLQIIGHLGKDATIGNSNGKSVINFSVAHSESWTDNSGVKQSRTVWVDCHYWTDKTTIAQYLKKGTQVYCEGQPNIKTFSKNDGTTGTSFDLRVGMVQLLGGAQEKKEEQAAATEGYKPVPTEEDASDVPGKTGKLPF